VSSIVTAPEPAPAGPSSSRSTGHRRAPAGSDSVLGLGLAVLLALLAVKTTSGADLGSTWGEIALGAAGALVGVAVIVLGPRGGGGPGAAAVALFAVLTAFTALSIVWSVRPDQSWLASNQALAYLAAFGGAAGLARLGPGRWGALLGGLAAMTVGLSGYALLVKVFPGLDTTDTLGRMQAPFGYWNATGLCAALGIAPCLWLGARRGAALVPRVLAIPATTILISVVVLSYSRSAVLAAIVAAAVWFAAVPLRLRGALVLALGGLGAAALSGWYLSQSTLTTDNAAVAARTGAGHSLGWVVALTLVVLVGVALAVLQVIDRRTLPERARRRIGIGLLVAVALVPVGGVVAVAASSRGLTGEVSHAWSTLTNPQAAAVGDSAGRLVQFGNSRSEYWSEAIKVGAQAPVYGVGALGFGTARTPYATTPQVTQNAHSYPLETYADLGLIGVAISLALLVTWWHAARTSLGRGRPWSGLSDTEAAERAGLLTLVALIVAYGVQSATDWTWFIPGVTVPALLAAGWLAGRGHLERPRGVRSARRKLIDRPGAAALVAGLLTLTLLAGWIAFQPLRASNADASAFTALQQGDTEKAFDDARTAVNTDPLAVDPLFELSALESATGHQAAARRELHRAIDLQPKNFNAWLQLGLFELQHKQAGAALPPLEQAHLLNPPLVATQTAIAQAQRELK
jgi:hypothetical protein